MINRAIEWLKERFQQRVTPEIAIQFEVTKTSKNVINVSPVPSPLPDAPPMCGIDLIKRVEACRLVGYADSRGVATNGYGNTHGAKIGQEITKEKADADLLTNVTWAWDAIKRLIEKPLTSNQAGALLSWTFNEGTHALATSTLLKYINQGDLAMVPSEFRRWNKIKHDGGYVISKGLSNRREEEVKMWLDDWRKG